MLGNDFIGRPSGYGVEKAKKFAKDWGEADEAGREELLEGIAETCTWPKAWGGDKCVNYPTLFKQNCNLFLYAPVIACSEATGVCTLVPLNPLPNGVKPGDANFQGAWSSLLGFDPIAEGTKSWGAVSLTSIYEVNVWARTGQPLKSVPDTKAEACAV